MNSTAKLIRVLLLASFENPHNAIFQGFTLWSVIHVNFY